MHVILNTINNVLLLFMFEFAMSCNMDNLIKHNELFLNRFKYGNVLSIGLQWNEPTNACLTFVGNIS